MLGFILFFVKPEVLIVLFHLTFCIFEAKFKASEK